MAITAVTKRPLSEDGPARYSTSGVELKRSFDVFSNNPEADFPANVKAAPTLPKLGDAHPTVPTALCMEVEIDPVEDGRVFRVNCKYATFKRSGVSFLNTSGVAPVAEYASPLLRPAELRWSIDGREIVAERAFARSDDDGASWFPANPNFDGFPLLAITNSAGQQFDPPVMAREKIITGTLTRNEEIYDPLTAAGYIDCVNSDVFIGLPPRTVLLDAWTGERQWEQGIYYWRVTYVILIRAATWDDVLLNQGLASLDSNGKLVVAVDASGLPYGQPVRLNSEGGIIANATQASHYRRYRRLRERSFAALGIT